MSDNHKGRTSRRAKANERSSKKNSAASTETGDKAAPPPESVEKEALSLFSRLVGMPGAVASGAMRLASIGKAMVPSPEQAELVRNAGLYLRDVRQTAGLTVADMSDAVNLKDKSLLEAVEQGTSTMSFELILRLAALFARHDPIPFISKFVRAYYPDLWEVLEQWGVGQMHLHLEREREFINIYRRHDFARELADEDFTEVLRFTRAAFESALNLIERRDAADDDELDGSSADEIDN